MTASPDIVKYFHEEPALLEPVTPDSDPDARRRNDRSELPADPSISFEELFDTHDAYRGYLAGTNHEDETVGVTSLRHPSAFVRPVVSGLGATWWARCTSNDGVESLDGDAVERVLRAPANTSVLVTAGRSVPAERMTAVAGRARRRAVPALRELLDAARIVFFPEPAHHGYDWSFFSAEPMRDRLVAAFQAHPNDAVRRFVVPYQEARSESKFYFDTWQLTESSLPDYIEEV